jgi:hypothetical protein
MMNPLRRSDSSYTAESKVNAVGGQGRDRTADASLFRAALYQLSYLAGEVLV